MATIGLLVGRENTFPQPFIDHVNARMAHLPISGVFVCPHERDSCDCRKPRTGLFEQARAAFPEIEFGRSVVVGERLFTTSQAGVLASSLRTLAQQVWVPFG